MSPDQELDLLTKLRLRLWDILESSLDNIADPIDAYSSQPTNKSTKISDSPIRSDSDSTTEFITDADMWYADSLGLSLTKSTAHAYEDDRNNNEEREHLKECPSLSNNSLSTPSEVPISTLPQMETIDLDHHRHTSLTESKIAAHCAHHLITEAQQQLNFGSLTIASPHFLQFGIGATENSPNAFSDFVALNSTLKFSTHGMTHKVTGKAAIMLDSKEWSTIWNVLHNFHSSPPAASMSSQISEEAEDSNLTAQSVNDQSEIVISEHTEHAEVQLPGNPLNDENQSFLSLSATTTFDNDPLVGDSTFSCHPLLGTASNEVSPVSTFVPALVVPVLDQFVQAEFSSG